MIRNPHTLTDLNAFANTFFNEIENEFQLSPKLNAYSVSYLKPVMSYLGVNLKKIITSRPDVLEMEALNIEILIAKAISDYLFLNQVIKNNKGKIIKKRTQCEALARNIITKQIAEVFNYDYNNESFVKKDQGAVAYRHAERLGINTCLYCNTNFTYTIKNKRLKCRPQFDHYLNKGRYPYFALSFYNLIPSCALCNSGALKGTKHFSINTHLHPFIDDIEGLYKFRTNINAVDFLVNKQDFTLKLQPCQGINQQARGKAEASIGVFGLNDRYKFHKDIAGDILKKSYMYNKTAIEKLFTSFSIGNEYIFKSESEVKELVLGNYLHPEKLHKRILSKLTKDIAEEFGLTL